MKKKTMYVGVHCTHTTYHTYEVEMLDGQDYNKTALRLYQFLEENGVNVSDSVQGIECIAHDLTEGEIDYEIETIKGDN